MMLVFGVAFQTPLVVLLLARLGVVSVGQLNHYRRHVIVLLLAAAALLTPPDVASQLCLAGPMWLLYELGVLLAWLTGRRRPSGQQNADET
jgi:sec-independent protein translocase protein TatC